MTMVDTKEFDDNADDDDDNNDDDNAPKKDENEEGEDKDVETCTCPKTTWWCWCRCWRWNAENELLRWSPCTWTQARGGEGGVTWKSQGFQRSWCQQEQLQLAQASFRNKHHSITNYHKVLMLMDATVMDQIKGMVVRCCKLLVL